MKAKKEKGSALTKVRFSIGAKLIIIITIIVLVSLLSITALVSWLVREDLRIAAEDNNFEVNRRSAMAAEDAFANMRSHFLLLMQTVNALEKESARAEEAVNYFFEQNPQLAAIFYTDSKEAPELLLNTNFFLSRKIDPELARSFLEKNTETLKNSARGETALLNAAPWFLSPLLAFFFPAQNGGGAVLFSPEKLNDSFGYGANQSCLINNNGDILVHADFEQLKAGANAAGFDFIKKIQNSPENSKQELIYADFSFGRAGQNTAEKSAIRLKWESVKQKIQSLITAGFALVRGGANAAKQNVWEDAGEQYYVAFTKLDSAGCIVITGIEYNKVFEGIAATTRRNMYLTAAVLSISIMLIWFFSKSISVSLKALTRAAEAIEGGAFDIKLRPKGHDEIGVLSASFQRMCTALGIFGRFTNREIAVRAMRGEIKPGGQLKHATIFFSDIRGFTEKSENFTKAFGNEASDRIVYWLNEYLTSMVNCVEKTGGAVDKFIGDAVMAHWGTAYTAGSPDKDAFNCVKAALMMRMALVKMNRDRKPENWNNPPIRIGCGINTGIVTAGQIGSDVRMEYTVIGDPVNLASRTEALNKVLGTDILITEDTWNLVGDKFVTEEMPSITVKGKEKPVRIFAVINFTQTDKGPRTLADVQQLLGIKAQNISKADLNTEEKKYSFTGKGRQEQE